MKEVNWKQITNYPNYYISDRGDIVSYHKYTPIKCKPVKTQKGYLRIGLYKNNVCKIHFVHRLVAKEFLQRIVGKHWVNHKNGIKSDNRVDNLEWCTMEENMTHAVSSRLLKNFGQTGLTSKLNPLQVSIIKRTNKDLGTQYLSEIFQVSDSCIRRIMSGLRQKRHYFGKWNN